MKPILLLSLAVSLSFASLLPRLLVFGASGSKVERGGKLFFYYQFQNIGSEEEEDYRIFVHARVKGTDQGFGGDFAPFHPTCRWRRGEIVKETSTLQIPPDAPEGEYVLYIGFYSDKGRIEMDNEELEREGFRYEVFSFRVVSEKGEQEPIIRKFKEPLALEGVAVKENLITLESKGLRVTLERNYPFIREVLDRRTGERFSAGGDSSDFQMILMASDGKFVAIPSPFYILYVQSRQKGSKVTYSLQARREGREVLSLEIWFEARDGELAVGWGNVKGGFRLVSIYMPLLGLPKGKLVLPLAEGRLVDSLTSFPHRELFGLDCWRSPLTYSCLQGKKGIAVLEVPSVEDKVYAEVMDGEGRLGILFNCHTATNPPLFLQPSSQVSLHFLKGNWISSAHLINDRIRGRVDPFYKDAIVYKIFCDVPQAPQPITTFPQALEIIKRFHHLLIGMRQIVYLVGWQFRGHDTGYPAIDKVNERLGGREGLLELMREAKRYNAIVSFHDNYDDAYMDSPAWNEDFICRTPDGQLVKGGIWAGGQSYIINPKRYVEGGYAKKRVEETLTLYPIEKTYHIDVLSAVPLRYSLAGHTCTGRESCESKKRIIEMFREKGIDVTSELLTQPFLGEVTFFWHLTGIRETFFLGEEVVPFVPFCVHGKAIYGQSGSFGGVVTMDVTPGNWREFLNHILLENLPSRLFLEERMEDYREGRVIYKSGWWDKEGNVFYKGRMIRRGGEVFLPLKEDIWLAYSREGGEVAWDLPEGWKDLMIYRLKEDGGREEVLFELKGERFRFESERQGVYEVVKR